MDDSTRKAFDKLLDIRKRTDLTLKPNSYLRKTITGLDGKERAFQLRYYQIQMVLHLMLMKRFVVGDDMGLGKCVTGDTLIRTDTGLVRMDSLVPSGLSPDTFGDLAHGPIQVQVADGSYAPVRRVYNGGVKPTLRVTTRGGYALQGTLVHPILCRDVKGEQVYRKLQDLAVGDFVCLQRGGHFPMQEVETAAPAPNPYAKTYTTPSTLNPDLARFLGYLVAEGWVNNKYAFSLTQHRDLNPEVHDDMRSLLSSLFSWCKNTTSANKDTAIIVSSVQILSYLRNLGIDPTLSRDKTVPSVILQSPREIVIQFLKGYFDGEGSFISHGQVEVSSASQQLLCTIQQLLLCLGITSTIRTKHVAGYNQTYWNLTISGVSLSSFHSQIGFLTSRKQAPLSNYLSRVKHNTNVDCIPHSWNNLSPIRDALYAKLIKQKQPVCATLGVSMYNTLNQISYGNKALTYSMLHRFDQLANTWDVATHPIQDILANNYFYDEIMEITDSGLAQVYDIEVDHPSHSFVANGIISHNTIESIAATTYLMEKNPELRVLVLTKKSVVTQWKGEFEKFTEGVNVLTIKGDKKIRHNLYEQYKSMAGPKVMIAGYRSVVQDFSLLQDWNWDVLILDEASVFKSPTAQVHQICRHLANQSERTWGLTGTLIKNNLVEGYGIYKVISPSLFTHTPAAFIQDYCIVAMQPIGKGRKVPVIQGYRKSDIERFRMKIEPYYLGRPKHEVATELPPLQTKVHEVTLNPFQQSQYQDALSGLLTTGQGEEKEVTKLTAVTYCQEIVNHPGLIGHTNQDSAKLDALVDMLTDGDLEGEKVIIYTRFSKMVDIGVKALADQKIKSLRITGAEDEDARKLAQDTFQDPNSDVKVIWITNAGSDAINLQAAKAIVFYDTPFSAGDYLQIIGRMVRIGSIHDRVYAIHLVASKTIDERVMEVIERKMKLIEAVMGKRIKGEDTTSDEGSIESRSDITDIFDALKKDAQGILLV